MTTATLKNDGLGWTWSRVDWPSIDLSRSTPDEGKGRGGAVRTHESRGWISFLCAKENFSNLDHPPQTPPSPNLNSSLEMNKNFSFEVQDYKSKTNPAISDEY